MANMKQFEFAVTPEVMRVLRGQGLTFKQCAEACGCSDDTLKRYRDDDPELEAACLEGQAKGIAAITNSLFNAARKGNITACIFYLKNQAGWKDNPEQITTNTTYVIMGSEPVKSTDEWVDKHKPSLPQPPTTQ